MSGPPPPRALPSPLPSRSPPPVSASPPPVRLSISSGGGCFSHCPGSSGFSPFVPSSAFAPPPVVPLGPPQPPPRQAQPLLPSASTAFSSPVLPLTPVRRSVAAATQPALPPLSASRTPAAARVASASASASASAAPGKSGDDKENQPPPPPASPAAGSGSPGCSAGDELDMYSKVKRRSVLHLLVNGGAVSGGQRGEGGRSQQQQQTATAATSARTGASASHSDDEKAVSGKEEKGREEEAASADAQRTAAEQQTAAPRGRRKRLKEERRAEPQQLDRHSAQRQQQSDTESSSPSPRPGRRSGRQRKRKRGGRRSESATRAAAGQQAEATPAASRTGRRLSKKAQAKKLQSGKRAAASASSAPRSAAASAFASEPSFAFPTSGLPFLCPLLLSAGGAAAQSSTGLSPFSSDFESELQRAAAPSLRCYFLCSPASLVARVRFVLRRDNCQQNALARCIDVSPGTLSPLLNCKWTTAKRQTLTKLAVWAARRDVQLLLTVMDRCRAWRCGEEQLALGCALEKDELLRWLRFDSTLERRTTVDRAVCGFMQRCNRSVDRLLSSAVLSLFETDYVAAMQAGEMKNESGLLPIALAAATPAAGDDDSGSKCGTEADGEADDGLQTLSPHSEQPGTGDDYIDFQRLFTLNGGKTDLRAASQTAAGDAEREEGAAGGSESDEEKHEKDSTTGRSPQSVPAAARGGGGIGGGGVRQSQAPSLTVPAASSSSSRGRLHRPSLRFSSASSSSTATSASVSFSWSSSSPPQSGAAEADGGVGGVNVSSSFFLLDSASKRTSPAATALAAGPVSASTASFTRGLQEPLFASSSSPSASSAFTTAFLTPHRSADEATDRTFSPFTPSLFFLPANLSADSSGSSTPRASSSCFRPRVQLPATATPGTEPPSPISCLASSQSVSLSSPPASRSSVSLSSLEVNVSGLRDEAALPLARALDLPAREVTDDKRAQAATAPVGCGGGEDQRDEESGGAATAQLSANDWAQVMRSLASRLPTQAQQR